MPFYIVRWEIEIEATTPEEAAALARKMQLDPESTANFFRVKNAEKDEPYSDVEYVEIWASPPETNEDK